MKLWESGAGEDIEEKNLRRRDLKGSYSEGADSKG